MYVFLIQLVQLAKEVTQVKEPSYWWVPLGVVSITVIGGIITAIIKVRKNG